jgi:hypothetical protein
MKQTFNFTQTISTVFFILLITFLTSNIIIGGDAASGKVEGGHYFVWDVIHKTNTQGEKLFLEVSKSAYYFNLIAAYLCLFSLPFFLFFRIKDTFIKSRKH